MGVLRFLVIEQLQFSWTHSNGNRARGQSRESHVLRPVKVLAGQSVMLDHVPARHRIHSVSTIDTLPLFLLGGRLGRGTLVVRLLHLFAGPLLVEGNYIVQIGEPPINGARAETEFTVHGVVAL